MFMHDFNGQLAADRMRGFETQAAQHRLAKQPRAARDRSPNPRMHGAHPVALIAAATFATDQIAKFAASAGGVATYHNARFSLGIAGAPFAATVALMLLGVAVAGGCLVRGVSTGRYPAWVAGLAIGGAAANIADRLLFGAVRDFIPLGPVIANPADLAVCAAFAVIACQYLHPAGASSRTPSRPALEP